MMAIEKAVPPTSSKDLRALAGRLGTQSVAGVALLWAADKIFELEERIDDAGYEIREALARAED